MDAKIAACNLTRGIGVILREHSELDTLVPFQTLYLFLDAFFLHVAHLARDMLTLQLIPQTR